VQASASSPVALRLLAMLLAYQDKVGEAATVYRTADQLAPQPAPIMELERAQLAIRARDFAAADSILLRLRRESSKEFGHDAEWWLMISLREQGRLRAALEIARGSIDERDPERIATLRAMEAQMLLELGRPLEAARIFADVARHPPFPEWRRGKIARFRVWRLTHTAVARAAAGDTARFDALADSIRAIGVYSEYGRDRLLHDFVRGLSFKAAGNQQAALTAFQNSMFSPTMGFTRTNYELAQLLLQRNRPLQAIAVLQAALRGPLEASNMYVTRTELHEQLAAAFERAGRHDRARAHYRIVADALKNADAEFALRRARALNKASGS
jgi:tetratricopeptide (TPR) repeat protein